jgi:HEPN domain-containing protein
LFVGHIALEKILKGIWVKKMKSIPPKTHNLLVLAEKNQLPLSDEQRTYLVDINRFNLEARYPNIKMDFYKVCDREFTRKYLGIIESLYDEFAGQIKT